MPEGRVMQAPQCPNCGEPIDKVVDVPYGWWQWNGDQYVLTTAATSVDVAPWVHVACMGELRKFHPQNPVVPA
jgi:hypothetical protein